MTKPNNVELDEERKLFYKPIGRERGVVERLVKTRTFVPYTNEEKKEFVSQGVIGAPRYEHTVHALVRYIDDSEELVALDEVLNQI